MPSPTPAVPLDPETGLPELPDKHFWTINKSGESSLCAYYSGAQIWKRIEGQWSRWSWASSDDTADYLIKERNSELYEVERIMLDHLIPQERGRFGRRKSPQGAFLWRYRDISSDRPVFTRLEALQKDAPAITEDNILEETTKTLLAWQQKQKEDRVLGEYPPRKVRK